VESGGERAVAIVASGLFGLLIGSFLNVVIYRLPRFESIVQPPSHCPACGTQLGAIENIPVVSWLALRGRCRHCAVPISPRYPIVELATAVLFVTIGAASSSAAPLAPIDVVVAATLAIAMIALDGEAVPPVLGLVALGAAATLVGVSVTAHHPGRLDGAALGGAVAAAAWLLSVAFERAGRAAADFPGLAACAAWGWTAGWTGAAAGLALGGFLVALALIESLRPLPGRRLSVLAAAASIVAVVVGTLGPR
jgi:leader peptidase (prepilin peptidase) / N-methyltransferase